MPRPNEAYLGDAVYVSFDGYQLRLTTSDGIHTLNEIYLEPSVYRSLVNYVDRLKAADITAHPEWEKK